MEIDNKYDYKLVLKTKEKQNTIIKVKDVIIGNNNLVFIGGPCSISSLDELDNEANNLKIIGVNVLRGGTYKLRTSPYTFQGLELVGLKYLKEVGDKYNLPVVSEITSLENIDKYLKYVDIIQVGARNMYNYDLLKALGKVNKPILLKRGMGATIDEFLNAAEYILYSGNPNVILCERGIKTFETSTRNTLDLASVSLLKKITHLPVIVDPSHGTGIKELVADMSLASIAANADGIMVETSDNESDTLSDKEQAISSSTYKDIIIKAKKIKEII